MATKSKDYLGSFQEKLEIAQRKFVQDSMKMLEVKEDILLLVGVFSYKVHALLMHMLFSVTPLDTPRPMCFEENPDFESILKQSKHDFIYCKHPGDIQHITTGSRPTGHAKPFWFICCKHHSYFAETHLRLRILCVVEKKGFLAYYCEWL